MKASNKKAHTLPSMEKPWMSQYKGILPTEDQAEQSIYQFLYERNKDNAQESAINYFDREISFRELFENINRTANSLKAHGVKKGDVVTICTVMTPETIYLFYALDILGATPNMVDPRTSVEGIRDYIKEVHSKIVCTLDMAYPKIKDAINGTDTEQVVVISPADSLPMLKSMLYRLKNKDKNTYAGNVVFWKDFFAKSTEMLPLPTYDPQHGATIVHTGGTTGISKGVILGDKAFNALALQYGINGFKRKQRFLNVMPPFIAYGYACGVHTPLSQGVMTILIPSLDPAKLGELLLKYKPAHMAGVPLHYQAIAKDPKLQNADISFLITSGVGGDAINTAAEEEVNAFLLSHGSPYKLCKGYGMTEVCSTAATCMAERNKLGSVGVPLCMTTIGIFEPGTDEELGYNMSGEVCISGPNTMLGYYDRPEATAEVLQKHSDGKYWIHSGDVGYIDSDGYLFIESRIKRVIIRHDGFKIFPSAIENAVGSHPDVETCVAVAMTDTEHVQGKLPSVFIRLKNGCTRSHEEIEQEVREICNRELAEYALPAAYHFKSKLPYTPIGKVDYRKLEELCG